MNRFHVLFLILLNISISLYVWKYCKLFHHEEYEVTDDVFVPSNEWRPIGKNQPIPRGLHVRINLQTGEREGRLLEKKEDEELVADKTSMVFVKEELDTDDEKFKNIKEALKKIKNDAKGSQNEIDIESAKKFRTYEELKKELSDLNLNIKTDFEVLGDVFTTFNNRYKDSDQWCVKEDLESIGLLNSLENLLHQLDNAEDFAKRNGFTKIVVPCLRSNSTTLKTFSARVLGAAVQNNARVQIAALKAGVITSLLKIIALEKHYEARSSSIFALSCLIRSFPLAEMKLIEEGGLSIFLSLFDETSTDAFKLQLKVVSLFYDLIIEKEDAEFSLQEEKVLHNIDDNITKQEMGQIIEKLRQYKRIGLKTKLIEAGWCSKLQHLLVIEVGEKNFESTLKVSESSINHDVVEKVTNALLPLATQCKDQLENDITFTLDLKNLLQYYKILSSEDSFYKSIYDLLVRLYTLLYGV